MFNKGKNPLVKEKDERSNIEMNYNNGYIDSIVGEEESISRAEEEAVGENITVEDYKIIMKRVGWALFLSAVATIAFQYWSIRVIVDNNLFEYKGIGLLVSALSVLCIGYPAFILIIQTIPNSPVGSIKKMSILQLIATTFVCLAFMYTSSFINTLITMPLRIGESSNYVNPIEQVIRNSGLFLSIAYIIILGPVMEEVVFRGFLLRKVRRFGDVPAMLISGLTFGLFHMNISQFLYAATLGTVFAYIALRTNTIRYTVIIHIIINAIGVLASRLLLVGDINVMGIFVLCVLCAMVIGIIIFIKNMRRLIFKRAELTVRKISYYILNPGFLLFILLCTGLIIDDIVGK